MCCKQTWHIKILTGVKDWIADDAHRLAWHGWRLRVSAGAEDVPVVHLHLDWTVFWGVIRTVAIQVEIGHRVAIQSVTVDYKYLWEFLARRTQ